MNHMLWRNMKFLHSYIKEKRNDTCALLSLKTSFLFITLWYEALT